MCGHVWLCLDVGARDLNLDAYASTASVLTPWTSALLFSWETWTHNLALTGLELVVILLSLPSTCWGNRGIPPPWVKQPNLIRNVSPGMMDGGRTV